MMVAWEAAAYGLEDLSSAQLLWAQDAWPGTGRDATLGALR